MRELLESRRVIVCCGTGGVGKTTISAALALAAARIGRRVMVLTVDPSRRLAEVLGVAGVPREPVPVARDRLEEAGIPASSTVHAWLLNPVQVADDSVRGVLGDDGLAKSFLGNPIYRHLSSMTAGMQEYTAMKALHGFVQGERYDLIILDTPPSRHALDFLDAPKRMAVFLQGRVFELLSPSAQGTLRRMAASLGNRLLRRMAGQRLSNDLVAFLAQFGGIFASFGDEVSAMRTFLAREADTGFLLITSPVPEALREAFFFEEKLRAQSLPFAGYVLNASCAHRKNWEMPVRSDFATEGLAIEEERMGSLYELVCREHARALRDDRVLSELRDKAGSRATVCELPVLSETAAGDSIAALSELAGILLGGQLA